MDHIVKITNKTEYTKFINGNSKALIFYTAGYCPSCGGLKPFYERLANRYHEYIAFAIADVEECGIQFPVLPAFTSFHNGEVVDREFGDNQNVLKGFIRDLHKTK